ncbi:hypothetical protein QR685DRAFT_21918 [Neurospora intermedia]|uniref:Uncharacterized protein n=1 Tax=Neurospora intermedia TaxID=5142 RepID=A0ABR3DQ20_NEUIN
MPAGTTGRQNRLFDVGGVVVIQTEESAYTHDERGETHTRQSQIRQTRQTACRTLLDPPFILFFYFLVGLNCSFLTFSLFGHHLLVVKSHKNINDRTMRQDTNTTTTLMVCVRVWNPHANPKTSICV